MNTYSPIPNTLSFDLNGIHIEYKFTGGSTNPRFEGILFRNGFPVMVRLPGTRNVDEQGYQARLEMDMASISRDRISGAHLRIGDNVRALVPEWESLITNGYNHIKFPDDLMKRVVDFTLSEYERFLVGAVEAIESGVGDLGPHTHMWIFALEHELSLPSNLEIDLEELAHAYRVYEPKRDAIRAAQAARAAYMGPILHLTPHFISGNYVTFAVVNPDPLTKRRAEYRSREFLDDMDEFDAPAGWLIGLEDVAALLAQGYAASLPTRFFTSEAEFRNWFAPDAITAREVESAAKLDAERARIAAREARIKAEREQAGQDYEAWQKTITHDRVRTDLALPGTLDHARMIHLDWTLIRREPKTTPGAWYDTGDVWYEASFLGETIYKRIYGNADPLYVSEALANRMALNYWQEITAKPDVDKWATEILQGARAESEGRSYIGSREALRIVAQIGTETIQAVIAAHAS